MESSVFGFNIRGVLVRSPPSACPDVKPNLSHPQEDFNTPGFSVNVLVVSDLLKLSKRKNDTVSFCNMSEQLLSAEAESRSISSLPPSL